MGQTTKNLPEGFVIYKSLDLSSQPRLMVILNIAALGLFFLIGAVLLQYGYAIRPELSDESIRLDWRVIVTILIIYFLTLVLHELVHGFLFFLFTGEAPRFGFKGVYAYAAAPDHFFSRLPYALVGLGPFIIITIAGLAAILYFPAISLYPIMFILTVNASGAVGDLYVVGWIMTISGDILVNDQGDVFTIFRR